MVVPAPTLLSWSMVGASSSANRSVDSEGKGGWRGADGAIAKSYPRPLRWRMTTRDRECSISGTTVCIGV